VVANYKETELTHVRAGPARHVTVDTYPGKTFKARVDSIQAGSGAVFSLLPPENATGNFVKVVQRVPSSSCSSAGERQHLLCPACPWSRSSPSDEDRSPLDPGRPRYAEMRAAALAAERPASTVCGPGITCAIPTRARRPASRSLDDPHRARRGHAALTLGRSCSTPACGIRPARQHGGHAPAGLGRRLLLGWRGATRSMCTAREQEALNMEVSPDRVRAQRVAETAQVLRLCGPGTSPSFVGAQFRLDRPSGFYTGSGAAHHHRGFGPRMPTIAGRYATVQHPGHAPGSRRAGPVARAGPRRSGRDPARFSVSVFAGLTRAMARPRRPSASVSSGWAWIA